MGNKNYLTDFLRTLSGSRLAFLAFIVAGGYFLWTEHQAHLLGALPYLILLLCPIMHLFMHRGHGGHDNGHGSNDVQHQNRNHNTKGDDS